MRTLLCVVLAAASVITFGATRAPAAVYFVDGACTTSGTGAGLGCGASGPFRTIGEGIDAMHAGDTLNIRGPHDAFDGIYREGVYLTNTRPAGIPHGHALDCRTSPCTLQGYNGERPVVQGARVHTDWVADGGGVYHRTMEAAPEDAGAEDPNHLRPDANGPRDPYNLFTNHPPAGAAAPEGNVELPYSLRGDNDTAPADGYWSYSTTTQRIYVNPPGTDDPNTTILVPFLYNAFLLAAPTANLTVQDLDFGWTRMMAADVGRADSGTSKPNLTFRRDHFKHYRQKGMIGHLDTNILVEDCSFQYCGRGISFNTASGETCYGMRLFGATGGIARKTPTGPVTYQYLGSAGSWRFFTGAPGTLPFSWGDAPWSDPSHTYATTRGHGIDLKQTNGNATHDVGSGFTVDHIEAAQVQSQVLFFDTSTDGLVDGASIHECGQAWVMSNYTPQAPALYGSNHVVRNSIFRNTGGSQGNLSATYVCGTDRSQRQPGEEDLPLVQFVNNFFINSGWAALEVAGNATGGNCGNQTTDPDNVVIVHNTFTGSWTNVDAHCGAGDVGCRQVVLRDVCVPGPNCTHGVTFTDNILDHPTDEALVLSASALANTRLDYELFGSASACPSCNGVACDGTNLLLREGATIPPMGSPFAPSGGTCETLGTFKAAHGTQEVHGFAGAPAFVAATDPHLTAGSAAVNRGTAAGVTTDIDGQGRDTLPDIGADEYVGGVTTTSSTSTSTTLRATTTTTATTTTSTTTLRATTTTTATTSTSTTTLRATTTTTATTTTSTTTLRTTTSTTVTTTTLDPPCGPFACTEVLGFSQTGMWYLDVAEGGGGTFEPLVGSAQWQLRAYQSAGVQWQDPNFAGWTAPNALYSACAVNSSNPDRVLLTISVPTGTPTVSQWVTDITAEIATIRSKYSNVRQIILQAVVGGPNGAICYFNGNLADPVHASRIQADIENAILQVVAADRTGQVFAGIVPQVRTCADYADDTGHLCYPGFDSCGTVNARGPAGTTIGNFYVSFCPGGSTTSTTVPVTTSSTTTSTTTSTTLRTTTTTTATTTTSTTTLRATTTTTTATTTTSTTTLRATTTTTATTTTSTTTLRATTTTTATTTTSTTTLRATTTTTATTSTSTTTLRATTTTTAPTTSSTSTTATTTTQPSTSSTTTSTSSTTTTQPSTSTTSTSTSTSTSPSTVTTTTLAAAAICGNGIVEPGEQCDDGNTTPLDGCDGSCQLEEIASTPAGTLLSKTFDPPTDPIAATLTSPQTGALTIIETSATMPPPPGVVFAGRQVHVEAPPASAQSPLGLVFTVDGTLFPTPHALSSLTMYRDGAAVAPCGASPWQAVPDPCLSATVVQNPRQVKVTLMTSSAGEWNFATATGPGTVDRCLTGTQLMLADPAGRAAGRRFLVQSNDTSQLVLGDGGPSEDVAGLIAQGGSLSVVAVGGDGFATTYALPAAGWRLLRARNPRYGVRYRDRKGPINAVVFKAGRQLQVTGTGAQLVQSLTTEPTMVEVTLQIGSYRYQLAFGSGAGQFKANKRLVRHGGTGQCSTPAAVARGVRLP